VLISLAHAADAAAPVAGAEPGLLGGVIPLVVMFGLLFVMVIWPQIKRSKEQKRMVDSLQKGDEVVIQGGIVGKVVKVGDSFVNLEIANGTTVVAQKGAVVLLLPKGTLKENL
jgi:preprotein translocase subunit YajC